MRALAALAFVALACTAKGPPAPAPMQAAAPPAAGGTEAMSQDIDAEFEARFERGELRLKTIDELGGARHARSARPYVQAQPVRAGTAPGRAALSAPEALLDAIVLDTQQDGVEFHVLSIGQADSMLVIGPPPARRTLLFDLGETGWNSRKNCLYVRDQIVRLTGRARLDYLVVSHFHTDHVGFPRTEDANGRIQAGGGIFCLLDGTPAFFSVGTLIDPGDADLEFHPERQRAHQAIIASLAAWQSNLTLDQRVSADFTPGLIDLGPGIGVEITSTGGRVATGDTGAMAAVEAASPGDTYNVDSQASPNDFSIGLEFTVGEFELFTAGDLTGAPGDPPYADAMPHFGGIYTNVESYMVRHWRDAGRESDVEVYVANHHGSGNSSTSDLSAALRPEVVIYSCGGRYNHPDRDIAERFLALGADQMVTTEVDDAEWSNAVFPEKYGRGWMNPVGDILIFVPLAGGTYTVATENQVFEYPTLTDAEEAAP